MLWREQNCLREEAEISRHISHNVNRFTFLKIWVNHWFSPLIFGVPVIVLWPNSQFWSIQQDWRSSEVWKKSLWLDHLFILAPWESSVCYIEFATQSRYKSSSAIYKQVSHCKSMSEEIPWAYSYNSYKLHEFIVSKEKNIVTESVLSSAIQVFLISRSNNWKSTQRKLA